MKCDCYTTRTCRKYAYNSTTGQPSLAYEREVGYCNGTRECDECDCGGDRSKCTFYPEVRKKPDSTRSILTCPFCGGEKLKIESKRRKVRAGGYYQTRYMICKKCHARGPVISSSSTNALDSVAWDGEVLSAWNRRQ